MWDDVDILSNELENEVKNNTRALTVTITEKRKSKISNNNTHFVIAK